MSCNKMLITFLACLVGNALLVAADECPGTVTQPDFDENKFAGRWYAIYQPPGIYAAFHHIVHDVGEAPGYEVAMSAVSVADGQMNTFRGTWKPLTPGSFEIELPTLPQFNGQYRIVATDYTCFAVERGCPPEGPIKDLDWIQFRDEHPTDDCLNKAKEAMATAQLDFNALQLDV